MGGKGRVHVYLVMSSSPLKLPLTLMARGIRDFAGMRLQAASWQCLSAPLAGMSEGLTDPTCSPCTRCSRRSTRAVLPPERRQSRRATVYLGKWTSIHLELNEVGRASRKGPHPPRRFTEHRILLTMNRANSRSNIASLDPLVCEGQLVE